MPPADKTGWPWTEEGQPLPSTLPDGRSWPMVSIVTPSYNQGQFLEETIRSVLLQGYPNLEYIVIDGCSNDESVEIIKKYAAWLSHWVSENDGGQSAAINKGWSRAGGQMLAWLNSDDVYRPGAVGAAACTFAEQPEADLVYGQARDRDEYGNQMSSTKGGPFDLESIVWGRNPVAQSSAFLSRRGFEVAVQLDETLHYAMDADLWLRIGYRSKVVFVDEVWSDFRFHPASKSGGGRLPFLQDRYRMLWRAFQSEQLPASLLRKRSAALAQSLLKIADAHYRVARDAQSRSYALKAIYQDIGLTRNGNFRRTLLKCLIGRRCIRTLKALPLSTRTQHRM